MLLSKMEDPVLEALRADGVEAVVSVCGLKRLDLGDGLDRKAVEQIMDEVHSFMIEASAVVALAQSSPIY